MPERFYTRPELAARIRKDVAGYNKLNDDAVLGAAFKARPEMESWLAPEPAPVALPPSRFQQMKDITKRAIRKVEPVLARAGQMKMEAESTGLGVAAAARASQLGMPGAMPAATRPVAARPMDLTVQPPPAGAEFTLQQMRFAEQVPIPNIRNVSPALHPDIITELQPGSVDTLQRAEEREVAGQLSAAQQALNTRPMVEKYLTKPIMEALAPMRVVSKGRQVDILGRTMLETLNEAVPMSPQEVLTLYLGGKAVQGAITGGLALTARYAPVQALRAVIGRAEADMALSTIRNTFEHKAGFAIPEAQYAKVNDEVARYLVKRKLGIADFEAMPKAGEWVTPKPAKQALPAPAPAPVAPAPAPVAPAPAPVAPAPAPVAPVAAPQIYRLPRELAGAKPRYAFGAKQFELAFKSDLDRAAYITAQATRSKRDADYLKFAQDATGLNEQQVRAYGQAVRARIKDMARAAEPGVLDIPALPPPAATSAVVPAPVAGVVPAAAPAPAPAGRYLTGKLWDLPVEQVRQMALDKGLRPPAFVKPEQAAADLQQYPLGEAYQKWAAWEDIYNKGSKTAVPMDIVEKYNLGDELDTAMFAEGEVKADQIKGYIDSRGGAHPLLDFVQRSGFINRDELLKSLDIKEGKKWTGRELSEDLAWYVRKGGAMGPAKFAAEAFRVGLLQENDKHLFMEELAREVEIKQGLKRGEDVTKIMQTKRDMTDYSDRPSYALKPPRDIAGQTFIPGSGPVMPTGKIRPAEGVDQEAFLEGFRPAPPAEPGLFEGPVTSKKIRAEIERVRGEESDALSAQKWKTEMPLEPQPGAEKIYKAEIRQFAEKAFNVPILGKATIRMGDAVGKFFPKNRVIREKTWGELEVEAHEVAHSIDDVLFRKKFKQNFTAAAVRELRDLDYDQRKRRPNEGFAEWFRYYTTTEEAGKLAPAFTEEFKAKITGTKMEKDVAQIKKMLGDWYKMGAEARIAAQHDFKGETLPPVTTGDKAAEAANKFYESMTDKFDLLKRIETAAHIPQTGPMLTPFETATKLSGKAAAVAEHWVLNGAVDFDGNRIGMSLTEALAPAMELTPAGFVDEALYRKFVYYASVKTGLERAAKGFETAFDINDMKYYVKKYANPAWDLAVKQQMQWYKNLYDVYLGPVYSQADRDAILNAHLFYVSAKRAGIDPAQGLKAGTTLRPGQPGYRQKGSGRPVINPTESMITDAFRIVNIGFKAKLSEALADFVDMFPVAYNKWMREVPAPQESIAFTAEKLKGYLASENIPVEDLDLDKIVNIFKIVTAGRNNIVPIMRPSGRKFYEVDQKLFNALEQVGIPNLGDIVRILKPVADLQRLGATGINASFGLLRNPLKDWPTFMVYNKYTNNPIKAVADLFVGTYRGVFPDELAKRWKAAGGEMANFFARDREGAYRVYDTMLLASGGLAGKALLVAKHPLDAMRRVLSVPESGPRLAEFYGVYEKLTRESTLRDKKQSYLPEGVRFSRALNAAQDVSINFTRNGYLGRQINLGAAYFNAAVQGPDKLAREAKRDPRVFVMRGLLYLTPAAVAAWYANRDKDWYINLPYAYRLNNIFIETKAAIYRIPQPFDIGLLFQAIPVAMLEYQYRRDPAVVEGIAKSIAAQIPNPIPSVLGPMIDVALDRNYLGIPIEGKRLQAMDWPPARTNSETMDFAVTVSKGLNALNIPLSPVQLQYLLNDYSGGMLRRGAAVAAVATRPISSLEVGELPILGSIVLRNPENPQRQTQEFFAAIKRLQQKKEAGTATDDQLKILELMRKEYTKILKPGFEEVKEAREAKDKKLASEAYTRIREDLELMKKEFQEGF